MQLIEKYRRIFNKELCAHLYNSCKGCSKSSTLLAITDINDDLKSALRTYNEHMSKFLLDHIIGEISKPIRWYSLYSDTTYFDFLSHTLIHFGYDIIDVIDTMIDQYECTYSLKDTVLIDYGLCEHHDNLVFNTHCTKTKKNIVYTSHNDDVKYDKTLNSFYISINGQQYYVGDYIEYSDWRVTTAYYCDLKKIITKHNYSPQNKIKKYSLDDRTYAELVKIYNSGKIKLYNRLIRKYEIA